MEINEQGFLEELLALRRDNWDTIPTEMNNIFSNSFNFDCFDESPASNHSLCQKLSVPLEQDLSLNFNEVYDPFAAVPQMTDTSNNTFNTPPFPVQEDYQWFKMVDEEESGFLVDGLQMLDAQAACKAEPIQSIEAPVFNNGTCSIGSKNQSNRSKGQPSKNLMAERRRRKRLNDRLSMLRSIVPKISKMDRISILGDTIDYTKELLERIKGLRQEIEADSNELNMAHMFKDVKSNEIIVRKTPKFEVERRNEDTRIEICCIGKQGLLLTTLTTLEALGLEIQQCVISCFNDFEMQASCTEDVKQRRLISSEDIKQTLLRNVGYVGTTVMNPKGSNFW